MLRILLCMDQDIWWPNLKITLSYYLHVFMSSGRSLLIFARFYELQALTADICTFYELQALTADICSFLWAQALTDDICTFLWASGAHWWYLNVFISFRRSLLIFARFYELQAVTYDICTFLWAPGVHCWYLHVFMSSRLSLLKG